MTTIKKGTLIYFGDPMCSWCWGIANHLQQLVDTHQESLHFRLVMGGLRPGGGEVWDQKMKNFLKEHWEHVQSASGQPFNFGLLETDNFNYDTEPSCRSVVVVRDLAPEKEFAFFKAVQHHFYAENADPNKIEFYAPLCEALAIDFEAFSNKFNSDEYKEKTRIDFATAQQYGIKGYPSIAVILKEEGYLISNGYATFEQLNERVEDLLEKQTA